MKQIKMRERSWLIGRGKEPSMTLWSCAWCMLLVVFQTVAFAQQGTITGSGSVNYNHATKEATVVGEKTFTSNIANGSNITVEDMLTLNYGSFFQLDADLLGGIVADVQAGGKVTLSAYAYNKDATGGKGALVYRVYSEASSSVLAGMPESKTISLFFDALGEAIYTTVKTDNIKVLAQTGAVYIDDEGTGACASREHKDYTSVIVNICTFGLFNDILTDCVGYYQSQQPIIMEVAVKDATLKSVKLPGMEETTLKSFYSQFLVEVMVNGVSAGIFNSNTTPSAQALDVVMGDSVSFKVSGLDVAPIIQGVPGQWIARFGGDLMYWSSPSITPGEFHPWLGYDTQVHWLALRRYDGFPEFEMKVPDWQESDGSHVWSWFAQRRMDATKTSYTPTYTWDKMSVNRSPTDQGDYTLQRANQKEGLNMQFLHYWEDSDFQTYSGEKYMMGFDDDEILYLDNPNKDATSSSKLAILAEPLEWQKVPNAEGHPVNDMVTAYRKNREYVLNSNSTFDKPYHGYEIQDHGTDADHPTGTATGNNTAPGQIIISSDLQQLVLPINVIAPLADDKGFYGVLEGPETVAFFEEDIEFSLKGIDLALKDNYILQYTAESHYGKIVPEYTQTKKLKDLYSSELNGTTWSTTFTGYPGHYVSVTAYYKRPGAQDSVMIAGKEVKVIGLAFMSVPGKADDGTPYPGIDLKEGTGHGAKYFIDEYRSTPQDSYTLERGDKYVDPVTRTYVFEKGTTATFKAWDGDPHKFTVGTDWYQSNKTLAKRLSDDQLNTQLIYYIDDIQVGTGRTLTHAWATEGSYTLKAEFRGKSVISHRIKVVDYDEGLGTIGEKGKISIAPLTESDKTLLGLPDLSGDDFYVVMSIEDVLSEYKYIDAPRANQPQNRWGKDNDYASGYSWGKGQFGNWMTSTAAVQTFLNSYDHTEWFPRDWGNHFSSLWKADGPGKPNNPVRPGPEYTPPTNTLSHDPNDYSTYLDGAWSVAEVPWQLKMSLASFTDFDGYRLRTNPSHLYNLNEVFDNSTGAFSGSPPSLSQNHTKQVHTSDDIKNKQVWYHDLIHNRRLVVKNSEIDVSPILVYHIESDHLIAKFSRPVLNSTFAVLGDYGCAGDKVQATSDMIKTWHPEFILSLGDDSYKPWPESPETPTKNITCGASYDENSGQYFHDYIKPYSGIYGTESDVNRFFPIMGNWDIKFGMNGWLDFFSNPSSSSGNERYYDFVKGDVHFFALQNNGWQFKDPDGADPESVQAQWLQSALASSTSKFNVVYMHRPAYSSGPNNQPTEPNDPATANDELHWPYKSWGADLVLAGDEHFYERLEVDGLTYVVNGVGGHSVDASIPSSSLDANSQVFYDGNFGALRGWVNGDQLNFKMYAIDGTMVDEFFIAAHNYSSSRVSDSPAPLKQEENIDTRSIIYPNPNEGLFQIDLYIEKKGMVNLKLMDLLGRKIWESNTKVSSGNRYSLPIEVTDLVSGIYLLNVSGSDLDEVHRVEIK